MILSASRRTDIPCFYSQWFMNRIAAGYVLTRNPMNHAQISRIDLSPEIIDCIVFWTKDPLPMLDKLKVLDELGYNYYFQFTLTPYDHTIERGLRNKEDLESTFIDLSRRIGKERLIWRYDPIILNDKLSLAYHKEQFSRLCCKLCDYTKRVTISFVDLYSKQKVPFLREITTGEIMELSSFMSDCAKSCGLSISACCEAYDFASCGIERSSCIDQKLIEKLCGAPLNIKTDKNQRQGCGCFESIDIGIYNTCMNGCSYCYANYSDASVKSNYSKHQPSGEMLIGETQPHEIVKHKKGYSNKKSQLQLF